MAVSSSLLFCDNKVTESEGFMSVNSILFKGGLST